MQSRGDLIKRPTTMREVLDTIDEFLSGHDDASGHEKMQLWDVLTALRGPDNGDEKLKIRTTAYIRGRAFPKTAVSDTAMSYVIFFPASPRAPDIPEEQGDEHFRCHLRNAIDALWP